MESGGSSVAAPIQIELALPGLSDEEQDRVKACGVEIDAALSRHAVAFASVVLVIDGRLTAVSRLTPLRRIATILPGAILPTPPNGTGGQRRW